MEQFAGTSLRTRLNLLVLVAFIPVAVLIVYVAQEHRAIERNAILQKARLLAQSAADAEELQVAATRHLLAAVAGFFRVTGGQPDRLSAVLADLAGHAEGYALLGVLDPSGHLLAGSDSAYMANNIGDPDWFAADCQRESEMMGPYSGEPVNGEPVIYFARPIPDGDRRKVAAVAFAILKLKWMNRHVFRQPTGLPEGSRLTLVDASGIVLRYEVGKTRWTVPQHVDSSLRKLVLDRPWGSLSGVDENGLPRIYAFSRLDTSLRQQRAAILLEIPRKAALASSNRIFARNLILLAASALVAILFLWWVADITILRRIGVVVNASRRLAAGDLHARVGPIGTHDEISHLAGVFDEMAGSLQVRIESEARVLESLKRSREQLRQLTAYQNEVREKERVRIAREIHDQLGQSLTILKMDLSWMGKRLPGLHAGVEEKMRAMSQVIEEAMEKLHAVTADLRPVILDDFGVVAAMEWQAESFQERSGIRCRIENNGFEPELPKDQATALFRIFQELLTNIIRHADADDVVARLKKGDGELLLQVTDNGCGITHDRIHSPRSFGLIGIRERLYPFGGRVAFEGRPGEGTRVTVHLPLQKEGFSQ